MSLETRGYVPDDILNPEEQKNLSPEIQAQLAQIEDYKKDPDAYKKKEIDRLNAKHKWDAIIPDADPDTDLDEKTGFYTSKEKTLVIDPRNLDAMAKQRDKKLAEKYTKNA